MSDQTQKRAALTITFIALCLSIGAVIWSAGVQGAQVEQNKDDIGQLKDMVREHSQTREDLATIKADVRWMREALAKIQEK